MPRSERAKQFMPFDTLKGLKNALRMKEYEHERVSKVELSEEKATEISKKLLNLNKNDIVTVKYYNDGHYKEITGKAKVLIEQHCIEINYNKIDFDDIFDIKMENQF